MGNTPRIWVEAFIPFVNGPGKTRTRPKSVTQRLPLGSNAIDNGEMNWFSTRKLAEALASAGELLVRLGWPITRSAVSEPPPVDRLDALNLITRAFPASSTHRFP